MGAKSSALIRDAREDKMEVEHGNESVWIRVIPREGSPKMLALSAKIRFQRIVARMKMRKSQMLQMGSNTRKSARHPFGYM